MQKQILTLGVMLMALTGLVSWGIPGASAGAPSSSPPNWAQVDRTGFWNCTSVADGFALIPDLSVALTISGGPVLLTLNLAIEGIPGVLPRSVLSSTGSSKPPMI